MIKWHAVFGDCSPRAVTRSPAVACPRLRNRRRIRPPSLFVAAILEGDDEVGTVEKLVTVPVAFGPAAGFTLDVAQSINPALFVLARLEHLHDVAAVELAVQVGVAKPGLLEVLDPDSVVVVLTTLSSFRSNAASANQT